METNTTTAPVTAVKLHGEMNVLLSSFQVYYQNLRGFHWYIVGPEFFTLHEKFEEMYNDAAAKSDAIAERIRMAPASPMHRLTDYLEHSKIEEAKTSADAHNIVNQILDSLKTLISIEKEIRKMAEELGDNGTSDMMTDFITGQEKEIWMFTAFISKASN